MEPCASESIWTDAFKMIGIIVPHVVNLILALLTYRKVVRNSRRVKEVQRALNGKAESEAKQE